MEILKSLVEQGYEIEFGYEDSMGNTDMSHEWEKLTYSSFAWLDQVSEDLESSIKNILDSNKKDIEQGFEEGLFVATAGYQTLNDDGDEKVLFSLRQKQGD